MAWYKIDNRYRIFISFFMKHLFNCNLTYLIINFNLRANTKMLIAFSFFYVMSIQSNGQYYYYNDQYYDNDLLLEGGVTLGLMNGVCDVGAKKGSVYSPSTYDWKSAQLSAGIYASATYKYLYEARIELTKGTVAGNDANSNSTYVKARNIKFKSSLFEASFIGALYPLMFLNTESLPAFSPYLMAGVGVFSFYPKGYYDGKWYSLRRLHTEGETSKEYPERKEYSLRSISFPLGLGLRFELNHKYNLRVEGVFRHTWSDYIDDASTTYVDPAIVRKTVKKDEKDIAVIFSELYKQINPNANFVGRNRGNANNNDKFFTINCKFGIVIGRKKIPINDVP